MVWIEIEIEIEIVIVIVIEIEIEKLQQVKELRNPCAQWLRVRVGCSIDRLLERTAQPNRIFIFPPTKTSRLGVNAGH
jgi:hypothetical protein